MFTQINNNNDPFSIIEEMSLKLKQPDNSQDIASELYQQVAPQPLPMTELHKTKENPKPDKLTSKKTTTAEPIPAEEDQTANKPSLALHRSHRKTRP